MRLEAWAVNILSQVLSYYLQHHELCNFPLELLQHQFCIKHNTSPRWAQPALFFFSSFPSWGNKLCNFTSQRFQLREIHNWKVSLWNRKITADKGGKRGRVVTQQQNAQSLNCSGLKIDQNRESSFHSILFAINLKNWSKLWNKCLEVFFRTFYSFEQQRVEEKKAKVLRWKMSLINI